MPLRSSGARPGLSGATCIMTQIAAGESAGNRETAFFSGSRPPAEAPTTKSSIFPTLAARLMMPLNKATAPGFCFRIHLDLPEDSHAGQQR